MPPLKVDAPVKVETPVTPSVPPIVASLVTARPVPAPWIATVPVKVLLPAKDWELVLTRPTLVASAVCKKILEPLITAPLAALV